MTTTRRPGGGRKPLSSEPLERVQIKVTREMKAWLHQQPNASEIIRQAVEDKMAKTQYGIDLIGYDDQVIDTVEADPKLSIEENLMRQWLAFPNLLVSATVNGTSYHLDRDGRLVTE